MVGRRIHLALLALLLAAGGGVLYLALRPAAAGPLALRIHALIGDEALQLGHGAYANPGGEGTFAIRDFQFFLSNVRLVGENAEYHEPTSYHLVRFDGDDGVFRMELEEVPREEWTRIEFGIGVDSAANASYAPVGDLDPNGRMAWGWEIGYKFVLVEGGLEVGDTRLPLVYHVGFDENYREVSIPLDAASPAGEHSTIHLCADLRRMFAGERMVDMRQVSTVTFERSDSRLLADNYASMVSRCPSEDLGS